MGTYSRYLSVSGAIVAGLVITSEHALADIQTLSCAADSNSVWGTLSIDNVADSVGLQLTNPTSIGPGNYSGTGIYPGQLTDTQITWTIQFSATYNNYILTTQTGQLEEQVYESDNNSLLSDNIVATCA